MPTVVNKPTLPKVMDPEQGSVLDPLHVTLLRKAVDLLGIDDPNTAIESLISPLHISSKVTMPIADRVARILKAHRLPVSETNRITRAVEQGFDEPVWHGTTEDIREFIPGHKRAKIPGGTTGDLGIHLASNPSTAENATLRGWGTHKIGANIMPLLAKLDETLKVPDAGMFKYPSAWISAINSRGGPKTAIHKELYDLAKTVDNIRTRTYDDTVNRWAEVLQDFMRKNGLGGFKYTNIIEGAGEPSYMVMDPRRLRSIWAQFDPKKLGKTKDLMASIAGAAALQGVGDEK